MLGRKARPGQVYYFNHAMRQKEWKPPRVASTVAVAREWVSKDTKWPKPLSWQALKPAVMVSTAAKGPKLVATVSTAAKWPKPAASVRVLPGCLSLLSVLHSKSVPCGACVWAW